MAINAGHKNHLQKPQGNRRTRRTAGTRWGAMGAAAMAVAAPALLAACPARAQITGTVGSSGGIYTGAYLESLILGYNIIQPNSTANPPTFVDFTSTGYGFVLNPYIGVTLGVAGTYTINYGSNYTETHNVPGMIAIGNIGGSLRSTTDNARALQGQNYGDLLSNIIGYGIWPTASWYDNGTLKIADYPSYVTVLIDAGLPNTGTGGGVGGGTGGTTTGTLIPVLGGTGTTVAGGIPIYYNGVLTTTYNIGTNLQIREQIRLFRSTAQLRWEVINTDTVSHKVQLRFASNIRAKKLKTVASGANLNTFSGFFFESPKGGLSLDAVDLPREAPIPDQFAVYGSRYQPDDASQPGFDVTVPTFAARQILRGFGATPPRRMFIRDYYELRPNAGGFENDIPIPLPAIPEFGSVATALYWDVTVSPNQTSSPIITYYGNGAPTEQLDADLVVGAEAVESLGYDTSAALNAAVAGNTAADPLAVGSLFQFPNTFQVLGSAYNRVPDDPARALNLTDARASIVLPQGLALANIPNSSPAQQDVATKVLGNNGSINADGDGQFSWYVRPTGETYGTLPIQVSVQTRELGARSVTRTINVPATPFRSVTASGFQMLGFPFDFDPVLSNNGDPSTVINTLTRPVDQPVAMYSWIPDTQSLTGQTGRYQLVTQLQNGVGYMYRPNINRTIFARGVKPVASQAPTGSTDLETISKNQRQVILERGWNIISDPYVYEIPLNFLRFVRAGSGGSTTVDPGQVATTSQNFSQAAQSGLIRPAVFTYNPTTKSYDFFDDVTASIRPWDAYWIYTTERVVLIYTAPTKPGTLIVPTPDPDTGTPTEPATRKVGNIASGRALVARPTTSNWTLQLVASSADGKGDRATIIGTSPNAATSKSASLPKPPPPYSDYVYLSIVGDKGNGRYAKDLKDPNAPLSWDMELTSDQDGPVTLTWPNAATLPRRVALTLKDNSGKSIALRSTSAFTIQARKGVPSRFTITANLNASQPLNITNLATRQTRGQSGSSYTFSFNVSRAATVTGQILTTSGNVVATFAASRAVGAGESRMSWNGKAQNGSPLPPGPYQLQILARTDDGQVAPVRRQFMTLQ